MDIVFRRRSGKRADGSNDAAHNLGAWTQPYRAAVARAESSLERRTAFPGDTANY